MSKKNFLKIMFKPIKHIVAECYLLIYNDT